MSSVTSALLKAPCHQDGGGEFWCPRPCARTGVAEAADTCSGLVIAADEDDEPLVGEGVQQMGGLEFLSAGSHQIGAGVAETRRNPVGQVEAHCAVTEGRINENRA